MTVLQEHLKNFGIELSSECKEALSECSILNFKKGSYLLKEGSISKNIGFLVRGKIIHYYNIDGKQITRWISLQHDFVTGFTSFVDFCPSLENLLCIEDSEIAIYDREYFMNTLMNFAEIQSAWIKILELNMIGYEHRVYQLLTTNAEERYLNFQKKYPQFETQVPQKYIASMIGIEPRHLSRIRKKIAKKNK